MFQISLLNWDRLELQWIFVLEPLMLHVIDFGYFMLVSMYSLFFLWFLITHWLFHSIYFNLHIHAPFPVQNVLIVSIKSIWFSVPSKVCVSLLIFHLLDLSIDVGGVLKTLLSLHSCQFLPLCQLICALYIWVLLWWVHIYL